VSSKAPRPRIYNALGLSRIPGLGFSHFARRYFGNRFCFLFLGLLRCVSSPRSRLPPMDSEAGMPALPGMGFPIRRSPDLSLFDGSPKLIAAYHVLHRLLTPRHPPFALCSLTTKYPNCQRTESANALSQGLKAKDPVFCCRIFIFQLLAWLEKSPPPQPLG
jgi:hypothetical protein